jgi:hypothetical protein
MKKTHTCIVLALASSLLPLTLCAQQAGTPLFNGKDLSGWKGVDKFWTIEDGVITGRTTAENPAPGNTFLVWQGGTPADFDLTFKFKMTPGDAKKFVNSGVQFRSKLIDEKNFVVSGYQADFEYGDTYSGILYEEKGRGVLAQRGQIVKITPSGEKGKPTLVETGKTGDSKEIQAAINKDGWNDYRVVAKGNHIQQYINGKLTVDVTDETPEAAKEGVLAIQLHAGPPMQVQIKDIFIKDLKD